MRLENVSSCIRLLLLFHPNLNLYCFLQDKEGLRKALPRINSIISNEVSSYQHGVSKCDCNILGRGTPLLLLLRLPLFIEVPNSFFVGFPICLRLKMGYQPLKLLSVDSVRVDQLHYVLLFDRM